MGFAVDYRFEALLRQIVVDFAFDVAHFEVRRKRLGKLVDVRVEPIYAALEIAVDALLFVLDALFPEIGGRQLLCELRAVGVREIVPQIALDQLVGLLPIL